MIECCYCLKRPPGTEFRCHHCFDAVLHKPNELVTEQYRLRSVLREIRELVLRSGSEAEHNQQILNKVREGLNE